MQFNVGHDDGAQPVRRDRLPPVDSFRKDRTTAAMMEAATGMQRQVGTRAASPWLAEHAMLINLPLRVMVQPQLRRTPCCAQYR